MSAWTVIAHTELTGNAASIQFMNVGNIPNTYTDLCVFFSLRDNASGEARAFTIELNDTTPTSRTLVGTGSSIASYTETTYYALTDGNTATASTFSNGMMYIPNYTSSSNKSASIDIVTETNGTPGFQLITAALFATATAVTKIELIANSANFVQYSSATLYGITKGSSGGVVVS